MSKMVKIILILSLLGNLAIVYVAVKALEYRAHINEYLDKYLNVVNEFSGRQVFADENQFLAKDSSVANRVVFFGSQIVARWELKRHFPDYEVINRGVPHQRLAGFLLRFRPDVILLKPRAVVIEISSYNFRKESSVQEIFDYVVSMLELARYHGIEPIPGTIIPPLEDSLVPGEYKLPDSLRLFNNQLKQYCQINNYLYADFNARLADADGYLIEKYSSGAIDLNDSGYIEISREINTLLTGL